MTGPIRAKNALPPVLDTRFSAALSCGIDGDYLEEYAAIEVRSFPRGNGRTPLLPQEFVEPVSEIDVRLVDVVKRFGDSYAVDHISIDVKDGEFFSLLGPSGCGKTTTLRMMAG